MALRLLEAIEAYTRRDLILPEVLASAEGAPARDRRGSVILASLPGDVHEIGRALLLTLFEASGYTVHDLGKQVPIDSIVNATRELTVDALALTALLVTTSKQMPLCIQALDRQGVHVPVLVGGAAISRAFGRRSAILPDGRVYAPGVFYCRDVFEGLATLDALVDPARRAAFVEEVRAEIAAERGHVVETPQPRPAPSVSSVVPQKLPRLPAELGPRSVAVDLTDVWQHLDRNTLFRFHWGGHRAESERYDRLVRDLFEPTLAELMADARQAGWLHPQIVSGSFACNADADSLLLFDGPDELLRLEFPRQADGERACLADYFLPLNAGARDRVVLQAVTVGPRAAEYIQELQRSRQFARMLFVNGLASATAEALADYAHALARRELGIGADQGLRFSWGYGACPDLHQQHAVLSILDAERLIGLRLTASDTLDPEHSTAALIVHHSGARYFSVR